MDIYIWHDWLPEIDKIGKERLSKEEKTKKNDKRICVNRRAHLKEA